MQIIIEDGEGKEEFELDSYTAIVAKRMVEKNEAGSLAQAIIKLVNLGVKNTPRFQYVAD